MAQSNVPIIIVGAGWAGLAAAVELSRYNVPVTVLESAMQIGGRARRVPFHHHNGDNHLSDQAVSVDNGQHLLVGAYESTLSLLRIIGVNEEEVFKRINLSSNIMWGPNKAVSFKTPNLPAPLHLAWGLVTACGLSVKERLNALRFCRKMQNLDFSLKADESCASLFKRYRQPYRVVKALWEPLCLWGLNTEVEHASAEVFLRMLREAFAHTRQDSNLLLTQRDLSEVFPDPAMDFVERQGGSVQLGQRVKELQVNHDSVVGLNLEDRSLKATHVILATPYHVAAKLCRVNPLTTETATILEQIHSNPICTVYLQYPSHVSLEQDMLGMVDTVSQWVFDRKIYGQRGLIAVVINGPGSHMNLTNAQLIAAVSRELAQHFPQWPAHQEAMVVREKRATFHCEVNINKKRPANKTSVNGLWLAGDYTNTGLPATLEGAVRSGVRAARAVMDTLNE